MKWGVDEPCCHCTVTLLHSKVASTYRIFLGFVVVWMPEVGRSSLRCPFHMIARQVDSEKHQARKLRHKNHTAVPTAAEDFFLLQNHICLEYVVRPDQQVVDRLLLS